MVWVCLKSYQKQRFRPTFFDDKNWSEGDENWHECSFVLTTGDSLFWNPAQSDGTTVHAQKFGGEYFNASWRLENLLLRVTTTGGTETRYSSLKIFYKACAYYLVKMQ